MCRKLLFLVLMVGLSAETTWAVPIDVNNYSFELPGTTKQQCWDGERTGSTDVPGWTDGDYSSQTSDSGVESAWPGYTDGTWSGFVRNSPDVAVWNQLDYVIQAGDMFMLSVDARNNWSAVTPAQLEITLFYVADGGARTVLATTTASLTDTWTTYTLDAGDTTAAVGRLLGIELQNVSTGTANSWIGLDNVRLNILTEAYNPYPQNGGVYDGSSVTLTWAPGCHAAKHAVFFGTSFTDVNNANLSDPCGPALVYKGQFEPNNYYVSSIVRGNTYYWRIDEVDGVNTWRGSVWSFLVKPTKAWSPSPYDGETYVSTDPNLSWNAGYGSTKSKVFFGTSPGSLLLQTTITHTVDVERYSYVKPGISNNQLYYWRVDQVQSTEPDVTGDDWSFRTTLPGLGTMQREVWENITPTGDAVSLLYNWPSFPDFPTWSDLVAGPNSPQTSPDTEQYGGRMHGLVYPPKTGNYTFYIASDDNSELWLSTNDDADNAILIATVPTWTNPWSWTSFTQQKSSEIYLEYGKKYYISALWKEATGGDHCEVGWIVPGTTNIELIPGRCVSTYVRYQAYRPRPASNDTNTELTLTLIWNPGEKAAEHDVYFSDNWDDVNDANNSDPCGPGYVYKGRQNLDANSYGPVNLEFEHTYYWRVDEVNDPNIWRGNIWSFTTRNYLVLEDFESYSRTSNTISSTWVKSGGGSGYSDPNYVELTIVNGGAQSMPLDYNNTSFTYSDATRTYASVQNWEANDVKSLTLWLRGYQQYVGSFTWSDPNYTMTASGADIWDVKNLRDSLFHDEFHYAYIPTSEDEVTIVAKVESITQTNPPGSPDPWAKAGLMIRISADADSAHIMACVTPGSGVSFQSRETAGGPSTEYSDPNIIAPCWLRLHAIANESGWWDVTPAYSTCGPTGEPNNWIDVTQIQLHTSTYPLIGLSLTAHNTSATCTAVFSNVTVNGEIPPSWTDQDIGIKSNIAAPLYVTLQGSTGPPATVTHPDPNIVLSTTWQEWNIPLSDFTGVNLTKISKITIGVDRNSTPVGTLYFDDIRLYRPRCMPGTVPDSAGGNCLIDEPDLQILTNNWLISEYQVTPVPPGDANLVAHYKFDGDFTDSAGDNDGEPNGASIITDAVRGQVANFDGVNDYVNCSNDVSLDITGSITLSAWVKTLDCGNGQHNPYVAKGDTSYAIKHRTDNSIEFFIYDSSNSSWNAAVFAVTSSFNGVWHHVAGTYDGSNIKLYIDGELVDTTAHTGTIASSTYNLNLGRDSQNTDRLYDGAIDEVRVYSRALSQGEVAYLAGKPEEIPFTQPLYLLLTPQNQGIDLYNDGRIDLKDYAVLADVWLEELLWP